MNGIIPIVTRTARVLLFEANLRCRRQRQSPRPSFVRCLQHAPDMQIYRFRNFIVHCPPAHGAAHGARDNDTIATRQNDDDDENNMPPHAMKSLCGCGCYCLCCPPTDESAQIAPLNTIQYVHVCIYDQLGISHVACRVVVAPRALPP